MDTNWQEALNVMQGELKRARAWRDFEGVLAAAVDAKEQLPALTAKVEQVRVELTTLEGRRATAQAEAENAERQAAERIGDAKARTARAEQEHDAVMMRLRAEREAVEGAMREGREALDRLRAATAKL